MSNPNVFRAQMKALQQLLDVRAANKLALEAAEGSVRSVEVGAMNQFNAIDWSSLPSILSAGHLAAAALARQIEVFEAEDLSLCATNIMDGLNFFIAKGDLCAYVRFGAEDLWTVKRCTPQGANRHHTVEIEVYRVIDFPKIVMDSLVPTLPQLVLPLGNTKVRLREESGQAVAFSPDLIVPHSVRLHSEENHSMVIPMWQLGCGNFTTKTIGNRFYRTDGNEGKEVLLVRSHLEQQLNQYSPSFTGVKRIPAELIKAVFAHAEQELPAIKADVPTSNE